MIDESKLRPFDLEAAKRGERVVRNLEGVWKEVIAGAWKNDACTDAAHIVKCVNALKDLPDGALDVGWCYSGMQAYTVGLENEVARLKSELAEARKVPEGWKLVPVELTKEMGIFVCNCDAQQQFWSLNISECYHAMLDAAPEYKP